VQELRDAGYLPEAVRNYLALLGWGMAGGEETFLTTEELQREFALDRVSKSPAVFDEQKLRWMNGRYLRELSVEQLQARLERLLGRELRRDVVEIAQEKISTLAEFWPLTSFFFEGPIDDPATREKWINGSRPLLAETRAALAALQAWTPETIEATLRGVVEAQGVKPKLLFQPLRVAIAGQTVSPGIFETVAVLGRDETLERLDAVLHLRP